MTPITCAVSTRRDKKHLNYADEMFNDYVKPVLIFCAGVFIGCLLCGIIVRITG